MIRHARTALASLSQAHDEIESLRAGRFGQVSVGAISSPGMTLLPAAIALVKQKHPNLHVAVQIETSDVLMERLQQAKLDMVVGRLFANHDKSSVSYQPLMEEPVVALVHPGHPLLSQPGLGLRDLVGAGWIVPPVGSVLRHRFDLMFQQEGLEPPLNLIETTALLFITRMLEQSDLIAVLAADVARYYASHGMVQVLPVQLPCQMDSFGLVTRTDRLLSPGGKALLAALRTAAQSAYGVTLEAPG
jgi:DNA-binding transcriptional LysR family regulator